ncbi:unnamed protein product [Calypogeia fissa]
MGRFTSGLHTSDNHTVVPSALDKQKVDEPMTQDDVVRQEGVVASEEECEAETIEVPREEEREAATIADGERNNEPAKPAAVKEDVKEEITVWNPPDRSTPVTKKVLLSSIMVNGVGPKLWFRDPGL